MEKWLHWLDPSTGLRSDRACEFPVWLLSLKDASMDSCRGYREEWLELYSNGANNLCSYAQGLTGFRGVCLERVPWCALVQIAVAFSCQLDDLFEALFQSEPFKLLVETFRRFLKNLEDRSISLLVGGEFRNLILESCTDERDGAMNEVA